jgi:hypothetical protein
MAKEMPGPGAAYRFLNDLGISFGDSSQFLANGSYSCLCKEQGFFNFPSEVLPVIMSCHSV